MNSKEKCKGMLQEFLSYGNAGAVAKMMADGYLKNLNEFQCEMLIKIAEKWIHAS